MKSEMFPLRIIHMSLVIGVVLFLGLTHFVMTDRQIRSFESLVMAAAVFSIFAIAASFLLPNFLKGVLQSSRNDREKYHTFKIIQFALLESAALMNGVAYFITSQTQSLVIAICLVVLLLIRAPTEAEKKKLLSP